MYKIPHAVFTILYMRKYSNPSHKKNLGKTYDPQNLNIVYITTIWRGGGGGGGGRI
jgi:hypothetical protein